MMHSWTVCEKGRCGLCEVCVCVCVWGNLMSLCKLIFIFFRLKKILLKWMM